MEEEEAVVVAKRLLLLMVAMLRSHVDGDEIVLTVEDGAKAWAVPARERRRRALFIMVEVLILLEFCDLCLSCDLFFACATLAWLTSVTDGRPVLLALHVM